MLKQKNKNYWADIAEVYDETIAEKGDIRHEKVINPIVFKFLGDLRQKTILDAGCGNGYLARRMGKRAKAVYGIDFTVTLVKRATTKTKSKNIHFLKGNLRKLPFKNKSFNKVLCNMVLMDTDKMNKIMQEFSRVLKKDGIAIISVTHPCFENSPNTHSLVNKKGNKVARVVTNYFKTGLVIDKNQKVTPKWYYIHYHYKISDYLNSFAAAGFMVERVAEPNGYSLLKNVPEKGGLNQGVPTFIVFKLKKI